MKKVRVCDLREGDVFVLLGREYRVNEIKNGRTYYVAVCKAEKHDYCYPLSLGSKSKQWVERIEKIKTA